MNTVYTCSPFETLDLFCFFYLCPVFIPIHVVNFHIFIFSHHSQPLYVSNHFLCWSKKHIVWMAESHCFIILMILLRLINSSSSHDEYRESSCGPNQPTIRFPFQLAQDSQDQCVNPEFCLYCTENKNTMFLVPNPSGPIKFSVLKIDYESNIISISDPESCLTNKLLKLNGSSFQPYQFDSNPEKKISFFNCSSVRKHHLRNNDQTFQDAQDMTTCPIYVSNSYDSVLDLDLALCTKMFDVSSSINNVNELTYNRLSLSWPKPNCTECEAKGMKCKWKNNSTKGDTECFYCNNKRKIIQIAKSLIYASTG
jgi:hypothetical protein